MPGCSGTIERGHIYFFYRPKVEVEDVESIDDVRNLHMLLVPRPPEFLSCSEDSAGGLSTDPTKTEEAEMTLLSRGADAVPAAPVTRNTSKQHYRLITVGKKKLPDPAAKGRHDVFWGTVTSIGDDLLDIVEGLGPKTYETKTRGLYIYLFIAAGHSSSRQGPDTKEPLDCLRGEDTPS